MNKVIVLIGLCLLVGGGLLYGQKQTQLPNTSSSRTSTLVVSPTVVDKVPLMDAKGYVEVFLTNISKKNIPEAIAMMTAKAVPDEPTSQAWGAQFNAFKTLSIQSIEPSFQESWTDSSQSYKVTIAVEMTPESANGPIPYYGYDKGINIRWVSLEKENNVWKIGGIGTGP